jgi:hypothetical protein
MLSPLCILMSTALHAAPRASEPMAMGRPELGLGVRDGRGWVDDPGSIDGPRLLARLPMGPLALEASLFHRLGERYDDSLAVLLARYGYTPPTLSAGGGADGDQDRRYPFEVDRWAMTALVDWGFGHRPEDQQLTAGPHLYGGLELRRVERHLAWLEGADVQVDAGEARTGPLGVAGLGLDVTALGRCTLRLAGYLRLALEEDTKIDTNPTLAIDLLVRL